MKQKRFSEKCESFTEWVLKTKASKAYKRRIARLHLLYPSGSLSQLRGHPKAREKYVSSLKRKKLRVWKLDGDILTPTEKDLRTRSLKAVSKLRRKKTPSLYTASRLAEIGLSSQTIIKNTNAFKKIRGRWEVKKFDLIPRKLAINENGREVYINLRDSRYATTVGKYHNAIKKFLESGDQTFLKPFKNKKIKDKSGVWHTLDTNPNNIYQIQEMREAEEFWQIYSG